MKHNYEMELDILSDDKTVNQTMDNSAKPESISMIFDPFDKLFQFWDNINYYIEDATVRQYLEILGLDIMSLTMHLTPEYKNETYLLAKQYIRYPGIVHEIFEYLRTRRSKIDFLNKYSIEQTKYITSLDLANSKLIACAGSGKTRSIIGRVKFLVDHGLAKKNEIFAITFSRLAATDFHRKIQDLFPEHESFCQLKNFTTIDSLAKSILCRVRSHKSDNVEILSIAFRNYLREFSSHEVELVSKIKKINYLFVDEAQDLNEVQYEMILLLQEKFGTRLYLIGDPNQNIFQFRRSSNEYLINFPGSQYELTLNFRSSQQIIDFSEGIKPITTTRSISATEKTGPKVTVWTKPTNEIQKLLLRFIGIYQKDKDLSDVAIICPTRGISSRDDNGLSLIFNFLKVSKIPVNQLYNESGSIDGRKKDNIRKPGHINLLTYHGTKGLEFDVVFVMDFFQFLFNVQPTEEDHMIYQYLLYVATSRAISMMFICTYINVYGGYVNHWITRVNQNCYIADNLRIPRLGFREGNKLSTNGIVQLVEEMSDEQLNMVDDIMQISEERNCFTRRIYQDFTEIDRGTDEVLFGIFCEELFYWQYYLARKMAPRKLELIKKIIKSKFIVISDDAEFKALKRYIVNNGLTWDLYDTMKHTIPADVYHLIEKYFSREKELNDCIVCNNEFIRIIDDNQHSIREAYKKYTTPQSYNYNYLECLSDFFYLVVVQYGYDNNHYYYISNKGDEKKYLMENGKELFGMINHYVKNNYLTCHLNIKPRVFYQKLGILGEIDFIEEYTHSKTIVEIKCAKEISIKYYIQLFLYNFCYYYERRQINKLYFNKFKIVNLLTGLEHYLMIGISPANMFNLLLILADVGNLTFSNLNLVYDLETTGIIVEEKPRPNRVHFPRSTHKKTPIGWLSTVYPEIIEIAIKDYESEMVIVDTMVKPSCQISQIITDITGITNEMLVDKPMLGAIQTVLEKKMKRFNNCRMLAHNGNRFDDRIMLYDKLLDPKRISFLDTMSLIPIHLPTGVKLDSKNLGKIYHKIFKTDFDAHRAMSDVNALIRIMKKLNIKL